MADDVGEAAQAAVVTVAEEAATEAATEVAAEVVATVAATEAEAEAIVTVAESAVALAEQTTAAAELQAAENMRSIVEGLQSWRVKIETQLAELSSALPAMVEQMAAQASAISSLMEEMATISLSIPPTSTAPQDQVMSSPEQIKTEAPASDVAASQDTPRRKTRRWI